MADARKSQEAKRRRRRPNGEFDNEDKANRLKALLEPDDPPLLDKWDTAILKELKPYDVVKPAEESQRLRDLGVLERRYYIDQVFDVLTDKGEKALEFASHVKTL